ncbi:MAG: hypothetical protein KF746_19030 [Chitinophagaceae bacterium]|nr:hypothetical protein [Chitinophagaceae bacterium]
MHKKDLIINPFFITGLALLILNDLYLKQQYGNFLTGKLSDFAGLLAFPMFIAAVFPRSKQWICLVTGAGFIFWKSPLSNPVIDAINLLPFVTIGRVIDYADYTALPVLWVSHHLIHRHLITKSCAAWVFPAMRAALLAISFVAFCATSMVRPAEMPQGTIYIGKKYRIKMSMDAVIQSIKAWGYNCDFYPADSTANNNPSYHRTMSYYQTDNVILQDQYGSLPDTILNIKYTLHEIKPNKTQIEIVNITLPKEGQIQNWRRLKTLSKYYRKMVKSGFIEKID